MKRHEYQLISGDMVLVRRERSSRMEQFVERRRARQNRLLRALRSHEYRRLAPHLVSVPLHRGQVLHGANGAANHVYFPMRGVCGLVALTETGQGVEVGAVGCEGITSVCGLGSAPTLTQLAVHVGPADALRLSVELFNQEMDRRETLQRLVTEYYHAFVSEVIQSVACNRLHSTRQRYCRRLLTVADRVATDSFNLTHDLMAAMLGTNRPAITVIALDLKQSHAIEYRRNKVRILDRRRVEALACECYQIARDRVAHLLPPRT